MIHHLDQGSVLLGILLGTFVALFVHDAVQVALARALGDKSAGYPRRRATGTGLNGWLGAHALPHLDVYGAVAIVVGAYGWGAPVPVDERWRKRRWKTFAALVAGPVTYLVLAIVVLFVLKVSGQHYLTLQPRSFGANVLFVTAEVLCGQAVLSILPVLPVLDGGRALFAVAPQSYGWQKARYQLVDRNIGVLIALVIVIIPSVFPSIASIPDSWGGHVFDQLAQAVL